MRPQDFVQKWTMRGLRYGSPPAGSRGRTTVRVWGLLPQKLMVFSQNNA